MTRIGVIFLAIFVVGVAHGLSHQEQLALGKLRDYWPALTQPQYLGHPWNQSTALACNYFNATSAWDGWSGVFCNSNGSLTQLALNGIPLGKNLPDILLQFPALQVLNLYGTGLTGSLPSWIGALPALEELSIGINSLNGTLPPLIAQLSSLRRLSIDHNQFSGLLPRLPSGLSYFQAASNNLVVCPAAPLPLLSFCDIQGQGVVSCGESCGAAYTTCNHDVIPGECDYPPIDPPLSAICTTPQPAIGFQCESPGVWVARSPITVDSIDIYGRVEAYAPINVRNLRFYFSNVKSLPSPVLALNSCWLHAEPAVTIDFAAGIDASQFQSRTFTVVEILSNHVSCNAIADWHVSTARPTKSTCTSIQALVHDPSRTDELNKLQIDFQIRHCKTWLWILLGVLIPSVVIISIIVTIVTKQRYRQRFCPCLTHNNAPNYQLLHSEAIETIY